MPLLIIGAVLGVLSTIFLVAYLSIKNKKEALGFDRNMKDSVIIKRLLSEEKFLEQEIYEKAKIQGQSFYVSFDPTITSYPDAIYFPHSNILFPLKKFEIISSLPRKSTDKFWSSKFPNILINKKP